MVQAETASQPRQNIVRLSLCRGRAAAGLTQALGLVPNNTADSKLTRIGALIFGLPFTAFGVLAALAAFGYIPSSRALNLSSQLTSALASGVFISAGAAMVLFGFRRGRLAANFAGVSFLLFLLAFNWIAFGPGERNFTRKTSSSFIKTTSSQASETEGRVAFGILAGLMDLLLVYGLAKSSRNKT